MKLLVISHNPVSRYNAMGKTLASFLDGFSPEEVCQLYIYPGYPCEGVCSAFYRITDRDVLRSYFLMGLPGTPVEPEKIGRDIPGYASREEARLYRNPNNQKPSRRLIRDLLWGGCFWHHRRLRDWMAREKPDCIFAAGGDGLFLYNIALTLSREYGIPIVGYVCDEYYFLSPEKGLLPRLRQKLLREKIEEFLAHTAHLIVISRELEAQYGSRFSLPVTVLMTGSSREIAEQAKEIPKISHLTYLGNVTYGRWRPLADIGRALDRINRLRGLGVTLEIYGLSLSEEAGECFRGVESIRFRGFVQGEDLEQVWKEAELLVHAEDFSPRSRELVRHSVSTKIADSLASGVPLFAYGPEDIASMAYLREQECAFTVTAEEHLEDTLLRALADGEQRRRMAERGLEAAGKHHHRQTNSRRFYDLLRSVTEETV